MGVTVPAVRGRKVAPGVKALVVPGAAHVKAAAEAAQPALIETLHEMVLIESGSGDVEGLAKMAGFTEARLKALGATSLTTTRAPS